MAYFYNDGETGSVGYGGEPSPQEIAAGEGKYPVDEWNPDRETWDEFEARIE